MNGIDLARIGIASPCPKRWDELDGDERKRFCSQCTLHVHNLSAMRREEAEAFLEDRAREGERVCVTYRQRGDGTVVTAPPVQGLQVRRWSRLLGAAASLLFGLFPFLASCRPSEGPRDDASTAVDTPDDGGKGDCGIEMLGEVVLPDVEPQPAGEEEAHEVMGLIALPLPPEGAQPGD